MDGEHSASGNLTIRQLELFVVASRSESFSAAAKKLGIAQPSLSMAIAKMERQLGVSLFDRTARRVGLTSEGARLAVAAADLVRIYTSSIKSLRSSSEQCPRIRFAVTRALGATIAPAAVASFKRAFADHEVSLHDVDRLDGISLVLDRVIDFAIMNDAPRLIDLEREVIGDTSFDVVVSTTSPLARRTSVGWADLRDTPLILAGDLQRRGYLQGVWEAEGHDLRPHYEVNELTTGVGLAAEGLGFVLLPHSYLPRPADPRLTVIRLDSEAMRRPLELLYPKGATLGAPARTLVRMFQDHLKARDEPGRVNAETGRP